MDHLDQPRQVLAISLVGLAGFVAAVGFLSADRHFVSLMSGNTTRLAVEIAEAPERAVTPALLITGFVIGVAGGSIAAARAGKWRKPAVLGLVATLSLIAALAHLAGSTGDRSPRWCWPWARSTTLSSGAARSPSA
jgi:uncharacterized membrane protein YoaK (UPF0700 family)